MVFKWRKETPKGMDPIAKMTEMTWPFQDLVPSKLKFLNWLVGDLGPTLVTLQGVQLALMFRMPEAAWHIN